jgi:1-acyl-sn-glycerol-3-phosphate acyltransferase
MGREGLIWVRSILYAVWLYASIAVVGIVGSPLVFASRRGAEMVMATWGKVAMFGLRWIVGTRVEVRGWEHLPTDRPVLIASKHQAMLDIMAPIAFVPRVAFVMKRELLSMPVFGWYCARSGMIAIDRGSQMAALKKMVGEAKALFAEGRPLLIFPEGTRMPLGAEPDYKSGVAALYGMLGVDCVPLALNTGLFWPPSGLKRKPGLAVFEFQPVIPAGLKREVFMAELQTRLESASAALLPASGEGAP